MAIVNIGILAHVDAGKPNLSKHIFVETGVVPADVPSPLKARTVHLIGTPGRADFVAEVERSPRLAELPMPIVVNKIDRLGARGETRSFPCTDFRH